MLQTKVWQSVHTHGMISWYNQGAPTFRGAGEGTTPDAKELAMEPQKTKETKMSDLSCFYFFFLFMANIISAGYKEKNMNKKKTHQGRPTTPPS